MCNHDWTYDYQNLIRSCMWCGERDSMRVTIKPTAVSVEVFRGEPDEIDEEEEDGEAEE